MKLVLAQKKIEVENVSSFLFKPTQPLTWKAGQFLRYQVEDLQPDERSNRRFFTIASAPHEKLVMLTTKFVPNDGSSFKKDLLKMKISESVEVFGPSGDFIIPNDSLVDDPSKEYIFIAGGIGITPFRSIILDLDQRKFPINITLLYANKTPDFIYKKEFEEVQKRHPEFKIKYFVDPQRIDEKAIQSLTSNFQAPTYYISGPEPMVEAFEKMLYELGVPKEQVKRDYFPGYTGI